MADTVQDDLELKPARAGAAFRAEMFVTDFALRYWKHGVAIVAVVLILVLGYGQYTQYVVREQRRVAAEVAEQLSKLDGPLPYIASQLAQGQVVDLVEVEAVGDALEGIANGGSGTAAAEARMSAAEAFRLAGNKAKQREALRKALPDADGVLAWSIESALANLDLEEQKGDDAIAHLERLSKGTGYLAETATLDLGHAYESLARPEDASKVYADFLTRFPASTRADEVKARQARLTP